MANAIVRRRGMRLHDLPRGGRGENPQDCESVDEGARDRPPLVFGSLQSANERAAKLVE